VKKNQNGVKAEDTAVKDAGENATQKEDEKETAARAPEGAPAVEAEVTAA
jgi:hypothetical protein